MFGWFEPKTPLTSDQRHWINTRFQWLRDHFGNKPLLQPVVTPSDDFFPERYLPTDEGALTLLRRLCTYMNIYQAPVELYFYQDPNADEVAAAFRPYLNRSYALGTYQQDQEAIRITLEVSHLHEPKSVVATLAHELGHVHLLGDGRCDPNQPDHEPLTDLLTVYFGLGIFSANNSIRESYWTIGNISGWSMARCGYMTMPEYAYALALYAQARDEFKPKWARYLRKDAQALLKLELKHLRAGTIPPCIPPTQKFDPDEDLNHNEDENTATGEDPFAFSDIDADDNGEDTHEEF